MKCPNTADVTIMEGCLICYEAEVKFVLVLMAGVKAVEYFRFGHGVFIDLKFVENRKKIDIQLI